MCKLTKPEKVLVALCILVIILCLVVFGISISYAEEMEADAWVLRRPVDSVLIQKKPGRQPFEYWRYVDRNPPCGAELKTTGRQKGSWVEVVCLYLTDHPTGWVQSGFIVSDKPVPAEQVATVKEFVHTKLSIGGRAAWELHRGEQVTVYHRSERYCTCRWGVIKTNCITFDGSVEVVRRDVEARRVKYGYSKDWLKRDHLINVVDVR